MNLNRFRNTAFLIILIMLLAGTLLIDFMRVIPSIAMILLVLLGLSYLVRPEETTKAETAPFFALAGTFLILIPSWFYSENSSYLLDKWQIALPYLVLPIAFLKIPRLGERKQAIAYAVYFYLTLSISIWAFCYYLMNQEFINQLYLESRVMPTLQSHHPTFSLMLVYSVYLAWHGFQKKENAGFKWEPFVMLAGGLFLFIFLHIFSVRSGLLALYLVLFYESIRMIRQRKKSRRIILVTFLIMAIGAGTMLLSPTVQNKIANTRNDIVNIQKEGSGNNQSITSRVISYKIAWKIAQESGLIFGCGLGDIEDKTKAIFESEFPDVSKKIIVHNQFLFYLAAIGLPGTLLFLTLFLYPLWYKRSWKDPLLLVFYLIMMVYFNIESPLETQIGVSFSLTFTLLALHARFGPEVKTGKI